jgi:hypothetical protein
VAEFLPLNLNTATGMYFEVLLFASVLAVAGDVRNWRFSRVLLILAWGHAALTSARHVPLLAIVAAPILAEAAGSCWRSVAPHLKRLNAVGEDYRAALTRHTAWAIVLPVLLTAAGVLARVDDYPATKYPVDMVANQSASLAGGRLFTTDEWADYLVFHLHPRVRVFLDGRSDFFGEQIVEDYKIVLAGAPGWRDKLDRYGMNLVLLPQSALIVGALKQDQNWSVISEQGGATLMRRRNECP